MMDSPGERDRVEVDALITDRYLESLLARHAGGADHVPDVAGEAPPADIARAADRLSRDLLRLHPSFRFEEALALRLADAAARMRLARVAGAEGTVVTLRDRDLDPLIPVAPEEGEAGVEDVHPGFGRPLHHRRRAHVGGAVDRRRVCRLAPQPTGDRADGPRRPGRRPHEACLMPIKLPSFRARRDVYPADLWTKCPSCEEMLFNNQLDKMLRVCTNCGHHFRLSAAARLDLLLDHGTWARTRRRPSIGRCARIRRPEAVSGPARGRADRDRDARRCRVGDRIDRLDPRLDLRHGLRVHGRLDGRRRRREGHPSRRTRSRCTDTAPYRQRIGRGADAGRDARPHAAGEDARCARTPPRGRSAVHQHPVGPDHRRRLCVVRRGRRCQRRRAKRPHRFRWLARLRGDDRAGAAGRVPAGRVPVRPRVHRPRRRAPRATRRGDAPAEAASGASARHGGNGGDERLWERHCATQWERW